MTPICPPIYPKYLPAFRLVKSPAQSSAPHPRTHPRTTGEPIQETQQKVFQNIKQKRFRSSSDFDDQVFWSRSFDQFSQPSRAEQHAHRSSGSTQKQKLILCGKFKTKF